MCFLSFCGSRCGLLFLDVEEFKERGIDLNTAPELNVEKMPAQELYEKLFGPLGLQVELEGVTVRLRVKSP